jgi:hypothetical protein
MVMELYRKSVQTRATMGAFRSRGLGSVIQLPIQRLADQAEGIGNLL